VLLINYVSVRASSCNFVTKLPSGTTLVLVLLGIDQIHCDLLGNTKMYLLYMSIGNIPKRIRRTYSQNAFPVIVYFPILKGTSKETETEIFRKVKVILYHKCMSWVVRGLVKAGKRYVTIFDEYIFLQIV
jgi:hypothetical protein